ncbi:MAG: OmpA family protein [Streptosporangiales bacterium]|nr:OmpA family protein [Streptosporangiales bacterium]
MTREMMTSMRRTPRPRRTLVGLTAAALLLPLFATVLVAGGPAGRDGAQAANPWGARPIQTTYMAAFPFRVDLLSLNRPSPQAVVATFRLTNIGSTDHMAGQALGTLDDLRSPAGIALLDAENLKAYFPLTASDGECVCSLFSSLPNVEPGGTLDVFAWFPAPPADVQRVSVEIPFAPPLMDVPIGSSTAPVPPPSGQPERDPAKLTLRSPRIQQLVSVTDTLDKSRTTEEDDKEKRVRLSTDVLFDLNKADLKPRARSILRDVAKQIDRSSAKTVRVDGHADITGNDAINIPLSKRRAAAVKNELERLVERDVTFRAEGHGSAQPVASNKTAEGRRLNRRVTVSFAK